MNNNFQLSLLPAKQIFSYCLCLPNLTDNRQDCDYCERLPCTVFAEAYNVGHAGQAGNFEPVNMAYPVASRINSVSLEIHFCQIETFCMVIC